MKYAHESLDNFLNEDMGKLQGLDIPEEWMEKIFGRKQAYPTSMGPESDLVTVENHLDYKILLKALNDPKVGLGIVFINNNPEYLLEKKTERKWNIFEKKLADSILKKRRAEEEAKRKAEEEAKKGKMTESQINERWSHYYGPRDLIAEKSVPDLLDWLKSLEGEGKTVRLDILTKDPAKEKKLQARREIRNIEDPLYRQEPSSSFNQPEPSKSQKRRYDIYAEKMRSKIDKKVQGELDKLKNNVSDVFDKVIPKLMKDLRQGYSFYAEPKHIAEEIAKSLDLSGLKKLASAYDAVEPGSYSKDPMKASQLLKQLGIRESIDEDFDPTYGGTFEGPLPDPNSIDGEEKHMKEDDVDYTYIDYLFDIAHALVYQHDQASLKILEIEEFGPELEDTKVDLVNALEEGPHNEEIQEMFNNALDPEDAAEEIAKKYPMGGEFPF